MKFAAGLALALFATASHAQETRAWTVETPKDAEAWLRYATPDTDDQPLGFSCARKSGQVKVSGAISRQLGVKQERGVWLDRAGVRAPWPMSVTLTSEGGSATLRGHGRPDEVTGGTLAIAEFSTQAPFAQAFRKTGVVSLAAAGETLAPPPAPKSMVRKFLGACK